MSSGPAATTKNGPRTHRLDLIPFIAMDRSIQVGAVTVGPFKDLSLSMYPESAQRRLAGSIVGYHRLYDGKRVPNPSVIADVDGGELSVEAPLAKARTIQYSIEAFRYAAWLAGPEPFGPNSTHLHVESYRFRDDSAGQLTHVSRYGRVFGISNYTKRSWVHIAPVAVRIRNLDEALLKQLGACTRLHSKEATRLWRGLWWFNQAHHDDPYMPYELSILSLASAFEAIVRPDDKIKGLRAAIRRAVGTNDFDDWVGEFYGARSAISHGDAAWQPLFGAHAHIAHYRVASRVFPFLVEEQLVKLGRRPREQGLVKAVRGHYLQRLLSADADLIDALLTHSFRSLALHRNAGRIEDLRFLGVQLNREDRSTPSAKYADLKEWLRIIALSACRSASRRWPADKQAFKELSRQFQVGVPPLSSAPFVGALGELLEDATTPAFRPVLGIMNLVELAEAMEAAEERREEAVAREAMARR